MTRTVTNLLWPAPARAVVLAATVLASTVSADVPGTVSADVPGTVSADVPGTVSADVPGEERSTTVGSFDELIRPFLETYCLDCHGGEDAEAGIALDAYRGATAVTRSGESRQHFRQVVRQLRGQMMPPEDADQPTPDERRRIVAWLEEEVKRVDCSGDREPGHVTLRRLNRVEYRNTVRDLIGIEFDALGTFPPDDVGYSFDNIGDVLSLSPLHMEKYLDAAERIADEAILAPEEIDQPRLDIDPQQVRGGQRAGDGYIALYSNGTVTAPIHLLAEGRYLLRIQAFAHQGGDELAKMQLLLGDKQLAAVDVAATDNEPQWYTTQFHGTAGNHTIGAAFINDYWEPDHPQKHNNDRNLFLVGSEVIGPIDGVQAALPASHQALIPRSPTLAEWRDDAWRTLAQRTIRRFVSRAFRRPAEPAEIERLVGLVETASRDGQSYERGMQHVVAAVLVSPHFLFRGPTAQAREQPATLAKTPTPNPSPEDGGGGFRIGTKSLSQNQKTPTPNPSPEDGGGGFRIGTKSLSQNQKTPTPNPSPEDGGGGFRIGAKSGEIVPVDDYELASRLSYFLWSSMPDDALFHDAKIGTLRENLDAHVRRMLADERSDQFIQNFVGQWLETRRLAEVAPDPDHFGVFDEPLRQAMGEEPVRLFREIVRRDLSIITLLDADFTFLNDRLAEHYGIEGVVGDRFRRVELPADSRRGGLLTMAGVLTITSETTRTSAVKRGKWVLENLLNSPPPDPPAAVPPLEEAALAAPQLTAREQMELHRANPVCASCHRRMDPIGFSLEHYDAIGRWREDERGKEIETTGLLPDGRQFKGASGLKEILLGERHDFRKCLAEKLLTYALGRGLEYYDQCTVGDIVQATAEADDRISAMILAIVHSEPFLKRRLEKTDP